jgi:Protein of unknown function (DUF2726)
MSTEKPGCLSALLGIKPKRTPSSPKAQPNLFPYRLATQFFSPAEASFYRILQEVIDDDLLIFPKTSLKEFISIADQGNYQTHLNKIDRKHVDFLICDSKTLQPVFAIELDDSSHRRAERGQRDTFIDTVFSGVELPLVRIPVRATYKGEELEVLLKNALEKRQIRIASQENAKRFSAVENNPPLCPKHGIPMVLRTAKHGSSAGEKFWGCPNYPQCREIIKVTQL